MDNLLGCCISVTVGIDEAYEQNLLEGFWVTQVLSPHILPFVVRRIYLLLSFSWIWLAFWSLRVVDWCKVCHRAHRSVRGVSLAAALLALEWDSNVLGVDVCRQIIVLLDFVPHRYKEVFPELILLRFVGFIFHCDQSLTNLATCRCIAVSRRWRSPFGASAHLLLLFQSLCTPCGNTSIAIHVPPCVSSTLWNWRSSSLNSLWAEFAIHPPHLDPCTRRKLHSEYSVTVDG